jgi:uncharacterized cupin superfamily protein
MTKTASDLAALLIRNFNEAPLERLVREPLYDALSARLAPGTAAQKLGISVDTVAPGKRSCPYHFHHAQEELFIVIEGEGTLRVAGEMLPVRTGDVVFIPPGSEYPHQFINTSRQPMRYLSVSTRESPEVCEYPDSGKHFAMARGADGRGFEAIQRASASLDYWDGEP